MLDSFIKILLLGWSQYLTNVQGGNCDNFIFQKFNLNYDACNRMQPLGLGGY